MEGTITPKKQTWAHSKSLNRKGFKEEGSGTKVCMLFQSCHYRPIHCIQVNVTQVLFKQLNLKKFNYKNFMCCCRKEVSSWISCILEKQWMTWMRERSPAGRRDNQVTIKDDIGEPLLKEWHQRVRRMLGLG